MVDEQEMGTVAMNAVSPRGARQAATGRNAPGHENGEENVDTIKAMMGRTEGDRPGAELEVRTVAEDDDRFEVDGERPRKPNDAIVGIVLFGLAIAIVIAGAVIVASSERMMTDLKCFASGTIHKCKMADVERLQAQWRQEDEATKPEYGDVELVYFPQDAKVTIEQVVRKQPGWKAEIGAPETKVIPNKSTELKENEVIERLPLINLPIRERSLDEAGNIVEIRHYEYRMRIERDGYEPWAHDFKREDWQKLGPDVNYSIPWNGLDLVPKPETVKEPFSKAMREIYCVRFWFDKNAEKQGLKKKDLLTQEKEIQIRHGFKTMEDFSKFEAMLTADTIWWTPIWEGIQKEKCPEPTPATP